MAASDDGVRGAIMSANWLVQCHCDWCGASGENTLFEVVFPAPEELGVKASDFLPDGWELDVSGHLFCCAEHRLYAEEQATLSNLRRVRKELGRDGQFKTDSSWQRFTRMILES